MDIGITSKMLRVHYRRIKSLFTPSKVICASRFSLFQLTQPGPVMGISADHLRGTKPPGFWNACADGGGISGAYPKIKLRQHPDFFMGFIRRAEIAISQFYVAAPENAQHEDSNCTHGVRNAIETGLRPDHFCRTFPAGNLPTGSSAGNSGKPCRHRMVARVGCGIAISLLLRPNFGAAVFREVSGVGWSSPASSSGSPQPACPSPQRGEGMHHAL